MSYESETPFDSIEGAQEYVKLLSQTVLEAKQAVQADLNAGGLADAKQLEALRLVYYNLEKLAQHLKAGSRILNDLRTLRRLLLQERRPKATVIAPTPRNGRREVPVLNRELL
ncbi:MAG TPA: hypothetical protein VLC12_11185 [Terriglobales bacterium]|nr:hypothetical protein [Terriglobales bacterium]